MKLRLYTGSRASDGARMLATALTALGHNAKALRPNGSTWRPRNGDVVINWGSTAIKDFDPAVLVNSFGGVATAVNKIRTFEAIEAYKSQSVIDSAEYRYPRYAPDVATLKQQDGGRWPLNGAIIRTTLTGHSGEGTYYCRFESDYLVLVGSGTIRATDVVLCQAYIRKTAEYRVHVLGGEVIDFQKKRRDAAAAAEGSVIDTIRNHQNGCDCF